MQLAIPTPKALQTSQDVQALYEKGLQGAENTQKAYTSDLKKYISFCKSHEYSPFPITEKTVAQYIAFLAQECKYATIRRKIASLSKYQKIMEGASFMTDTLKIVLEGVKREKGTRQKQAPSFEIQTLRKSVYALDTNHPKDIRDRALLLLGFTGAFRRSELVALDISDLAFEEDCLIVNIRGSKTNQYLEQESKAIFYGADPLLCPIRALKRWLEVRRQGLQANNDLEAVFTAFRKGGKVLAQRLSMRAINAIVPAHLGVSYTPHSLRASFVTVAKLNGCQDDEIMRQTGHKTATMIRCYTRIADVKKHNAAMKLGL